MLEDLETEVRNANKNNSEKEDIKQDVLMTIQVLSDLTTLERKYFELQTQLEEQTKTTDNNSTKLFNLGCLDTLERVRADLNNIIIQYIRT